MTENEAIKILKNITKYTRVRNDDLILSSDFAKAYEVAIKSLEEIQSYRAIDTVEDIRETYSLCKILSNVVKDYSAIGMVEEFKVLKEKAEPKKIVYQVGKNGLKHEKCPTCGSFHVFGNYCTECGQRLNWGND